MDALPRRFALVALVGCGLLGACGGTDNASSGKNATPPVSVEIGAGTVHAPGETVQLSSAQRDAVRTGLTRYVTGATAQPLALGTVATNLGDVFEPAALDSVLGNDRAAMIDDGLPTGTVTLTPIAATVSALADTSGSVAILAATTKISAQSTTKQGPIRVTREGTFVFYPDGSNWRIHSYDVTVTRETPDGLSTTTSSRK